MNSERLIRMANQIGIFFESQPDRQEALEGIATHLRKFWDPRMRAEFLSLVDGDSHSRISPIVLDAVRAHRMRLD